MLPLPLIDDFLLHIQANNYSLETLYNYERDLDTFAHFLTNELKGLAFDKVTKKNGRAVQSLPQLPRSQDLGRRRVRSEVAKWLN